MERNRRGRPRHPDVLTPAEWRVLEALREGGTNAEIAARLGLSLDTVKYHISNMLAKLELRDRRTLASWRPEGRRGRLRGALFTVPAALWAVARPIAWVGAGTAAVAGVVVGVVAVVAVVAVALVVAGGGGEPPLALAPPPTQTSTPAATATSAAPLTARAAVTSSPVPGLCATPTDPTCVQAVYLGAPGDYAQVSDIPAHVLPTLASDGRYYVERGQQVTVVTAAPLPADWTSFYLQRTPSGTPAAVSFQQLIQPVGTTYTFTVATDEAASTLITFDLTAARPLPVQRPGQKPELGGVVVTTVFSVEATTFRYNQLDTTGAVSTAGSYAFLSDPDDTTTAVTTYEALRDDTTTALLIHESDADGASQTTLYDTVEAGDLFEWHEADDCFVRYQVAEVMSDPAGAVPRKLLAVEWMTYAFTGCSGAVPAGTSATVDWRELPDLGGASLTVPVVHGIHQLLPAGWTGAVEAYREYSHVPTDYPVYEGASWIESPTLTQAQALPHWRTPTVPAGWTLDRVSYGTEDDPPYCYTAEYLSPERYLALQIYSCYARIRRWGMPSSGSYGESSTTYALETRTIAGRPAVVRYSPPGPNHSATFPITVVVFDPTATNIQYTVQGNAPSLSGANVGAVVAIAQSLFAGE